MASTINSDNGVVSGSVGLKYASDNSGVLALQTNGNTAVTITSANNVGIGTTSPSKLLDVQSPLTSTTAYDNGILRLATNASGSDVTINFTDNTLYNAYMGSGSGSLYFATNGKTERLRIGNDGVVTLNSGQLKFPASQNASSDANTLDDYEEGTFSAAITMTTSGSVTLQAGYTTMSYTKVGRLVTIIGNPRISSVSSPVGNIQITLPFIVNSGDTTNFRAGGSIGYYDASEATYYYKSVVVLCLENTSYFRILTSQLASIATPNNNDEMVISFTYETN